MCWVADVRAPGPGQALVEIEKLDEYFDRGAEARHVLGSQPGLGIGDYGVAQVAAIRQDAETLGALAESRGRRADPLLGPSGTTGSVAQPPDAIATTIEVVELIDREKHGSRLRCHASIVTLRTG